MRRNVLAMPVLPPAKKTRKKLRVGGRILALELLESIAADNDEAAAARKSQAAAAKPPSSRRKAASAPKKAVGENVTATEGEVVEAAAGRDRGWQRRLGHGAGLPAHAFCREFANAV